MQNTEKKVWIKESDEIIELRKEFNAYALGNLPFKQAQKVILSMHRITTAALGCGAEQGFLIGYDEVMEDEADLLD
jgi:hypothetical protein